MKQEALSEFIDVGWQYKAAPGACELCRELDNGSGYYLLEPEKPHLDCSCEIIRIEGLQEKLAERLRQIFKEPKLLKSGLINATNTPYFIDFHGGHSLKVVVRNLNIRFSNVYVDAFAPYPHNRQQQASPIWPTWPVEFTFHNFKEGKNLWTVVFNTLYDDAQMMFYIYDMDDVNP